VVVGGAPVTQQWAGEIGADGYGEDALRAVTLVRALLGHGARAP
jgi:methanogenic corrinoid protein MtbC1